MIIQVLRQKDSDLLIKIINKKNNRLVVMSNKKYDIVSVVHKFMQRNNIPLNTRYIILYYPLVSTLQNIKVYYSSVQKQKIQRE